MQIAEFLTQHVYHLDANISSSLGVNHDYQPGDYREGVDHLTPAQAQALLTYDPEVVQDLILVGVGNYPDLPNNDLGQAVLTILSHMEV